MAECIQPFFIRGESLHECGDFDDKLIYRGDSVYEVIRIIDGVPLFLEDHLSRILHSAELTGRTIWLSCDRMTELIRLLVRKNRCNTGNIKVLFNYSDSNVGAGEFYAYFIPHYYPDPQQYLKGVRTILYRAERENPTAKIINKNLRLEVYKAIIEAGVYEAMLVNGEGCITEGSRSNVFFITGNRLVTAPDHLVLQGISRKYLLRLCDEHGIPVDFSLVHSDELGRVQSAFLTGTSPGVLPVSMIGQKALEPSHPLLAILMKHYNELIRRYLNSELKK